MKKKQNVVASWLLIVSLFMAGSVNTMGQEYKYYDLKYEVFETDGLFYLVSDTVRVLPSGEFDPEFPNLSNFEDYPFYSQTSYGSSLITLFTDGDAWLIPPYYAYKPSGKAGYENRNKNYHGELVVPSEVAYGGKTYKVKPAANFMAESGSDDEHLYSVFITDGVDMLIDYLGYYYSSEYGRQSFVKTLTLGKDTKLGHHYYHGLYGFHNLEHIFVSEKNPQLYDINGALCSRSEQGSANMLVYSPVAGKRVVEVPENDVLRTIGNRAIVTGYGQHLDRISIPATIDSLCADAISASVDSVCVYAPTPPKANYGIYVSANAKLYVPHGSVEAYANDESWGGKFGEIVDMETGQWVKPSQGIKVTSLTNNESVKSKVYNLQGRIVNGTSRPGLRIQQGRKWVSKTK